MAMSPEQILEWMDECETAKKVKGYVPAELQAIPMLLGMAEEGVIDIVDDEETGLLFIVGNKLTQNKKEKNNDLDTD